MRSVLAVVDVLAVDTGILAFGSIQVIVPRTAIQNVVARGSVQQIPALVPLEAIIARTTVDPVVPWPPVNAIGPPGSVDEIVLRAAENDIPTRSSGQVLVSPASAVHSVFAIESVHGVCPRTSTQEVVAVAPVDVVVSSPAVYPIIALRSIDVVLAGPTKKKVTAGAAEDEIIARPTSKAVAARRAVDGICSRAAADEISSSATVDPVPAAAPDDHVALGGPIQSVVPRRAHDRRALPQAVVGLGRAQLWADHHEPDDADEHLKESHLFPPIRVGNETLASRLENAIHPHRPQGPPQGGAAPGRGGTTTCLQPDISGASAPHSNSREEFWKGGCLRLDRDLGRCARFADEVAPGQGHVFGFEMAVTDPDGDQLALVPPGRDAHRLRGDGGPSAVSLGTDYLHTGLIDPPSRKLEPHSSIGKIACIL